VKSNIKNSLIAGLCIAAIALSSSALAVQKGAHRSFHASKTGGKSTLVKGKSGDYVCASIAFRNYSGSNLNVYYRGTPYSDYIYDGDYLNVDFGDHCYSTYTVDLDGPGFRDTVGVQDGQCLFIYDDSYEYAPYGECEYGNAARLKAHQQLKKK